MGLAEPVDELPVDAALGYLARDGLRTNVLYLPVIGGGDGGIFTSAADVSALWQALFDVRRAVTGYPDVDGAPVSPAPSSR